MPGEPIDLNLELLPSQTVAASGVSDPLSVEPGSDGEFHFAYTALTGTATLQLDLETSVDGGSNYGKVARTPTIPTTEDAAGATSAGQETKVHCSVPTYIPKSTQSDDYSGSSRRTLVRVRWTVGGSGTITGLNVWLAQDDEGTTPARERYATVGY